VLVAFGKDTNSSATTASPLAQPARPQQRHT
jgi:hypothetical protein